MKKKVALYKSVKLGFTYVDEYSTYAGREDRVRVSEVELIEFTEIDRAAVINKEIDALKAAKTSLLADAQIKANQFDEKIQELLAIEGAK